MFYPAVNQKRERPFQKYTYTCGVPKSRIFRAKLKRKRRKLSFTTFSYPPLPKLFVLCFRERSWLGSRISKDLAYFRLLQPLNYKMMKTDSPLLEKLSPRSKNYEAYSRAL